MSSYTSYNSYPQARRPASRVSSVASSSTATLAPSPNLSAVKQALDILHEMATVLNLGLDKQQLASCIKLLEDGIDPVALANVIQKFQAEATKHASEPKYTLVP